MAHPLVQAAFSSVKFAKRRASARFSEKNPEIETIIIDVDRTITNEDSPKLALAKLVGHDKSKEILDSLLSKVLSGKLKLEEIHSAVFSELYDRGFKQSDWVLIMEELDRNGGLRKNLIHDLLEISGKSDVTLVLATRASVESAQWLCRRFGFHHAVGSVERVNGKFEGFDTMIGAYDNGNGTITKLSAAAKVMLASGKVLDPSKTAVIANDLLDVLEMLRSARGVVILPSEPNRLERITAFLKLYDILIRENEIGTNLKNALGF